MLPDNKKEGTYDTTNSKNLTKEQGRLKKAGENKESAAMLTSEEWKPITGRTYDMETRRKGSSKGYKIVAGKHFKSFPIVK